MTPGLEDATIAAFFKEFEDLVLSKASEDQKRDMQIAFYMGAQALYTVFSMVCDDESLSDDESDNKLNEVGDEIQNFVMALDPTKFNLH